MCKHTTVVELTSAYNVHYHAIFQVPLNLCENNNASKYIHDRIRKHKCFGMSKIVQVTNTNGWMEYISKDVEETKAYVYPILQDDYNVFPIATGESEQDGIIIEL